MDKLKGIFPLSFKYTKDAANLVLGIIIYICIGVVAGFAIGLATRLVGWMPALGRLVGTILGFGGTLVSVYVFAGIVVLILTFLKIIK